uniref:Uncharacterized protein n=1 Tax=Opuntia streptacantha TaxID=393608 RepID=A0A7C8Z4A3_OPUST
MSVDMAFYFHDTSFLMTVYLFSSQQSDCCHIRQGPSACLPYRYQNPWKRSVFSVPFLILGSFAYHQCVLRCKTACCLTDSYNSHCYNRTCLKSQHSFCEGILLQAWQVTLMLYLLVQTDHEHEWHLSTAFSSLTSQYQPKYSKSASCFEHFA